MASQFLDGSLLDIMLIRPGGKWQFDLDQCLDLHLEAST